MVERATVGGRCYGAVATVAIYILHNFVSERLRARARVSVNVYVYALEFLCVCLCCVCRCVCVCVNMCVFVCVPSTTTTITAAAATTITARRACWPIDRHRRTDAPKAPSVRVYRYILIVCTYTAAAMRT